MDTQDSVMSFFQSWVKHFAPEYEKITVFCLYQGIVSLPKNVSVFSLSKEKYRNFLLRRILYILRLLYLSFRYRKDYDIVFVHMNKEYVLVSGLLWKLLGKPICLWYNHYAGSFLTDIAAFLCNKIFYTSKFSYTAKYPQSVQMSVGVDTTKFVLNNSVQRKSPSLLFLGRISPSKRLDIFINAFVSISQQDKYKCIASVYGPTMAADKEYLNKWKSVIDKNNLSNKLTFHDGISTAETPSVYASHNIFINCSKSGMYDKTLFEAAASGCIVITSSQDFRILAGDEHYFDISQPDELTHKIIPFLKISNDDLELIRIKMRRIADAHSLSALSKQIHSHLEFIL